MKTAELAYLEANLKNIFDRRADFAVDEDWVVVGEDQMMSAGDAIEDREVVHLLRGCAR